MPACRCEFDCVGEKVHQNLSHFFRIRACDDAGVARDPVEDEPSLCDEWLDQLDGVPERVTTIDVANGVRHTAASGSREVEDFSDEEGEVLLIGFDPREVGALIIGHGPPQSQVEELDIAAYRIEWRAQLVAHRAEKRRVRTVRGLGIVGETAFAQCTEEQLLGDLPL